MFISILPLATDTLVSHRVFKPEGSMTWHVDFVYGHCVRTFDGSLWRVRARTLTD